jgi:ubiquitin-like 1-activating enzyme E1 B
MRPLNVCLGAPYLAAKEIENLRQEARAFTAVRNLLRSPNSAQTNGVANGSADGARLAFDKVLSSRVRCTLVLLTLTILIQVFKSDVLRLLSMEDMWKNRTKPTALEFEAIRDGTFVLPSPPQAQTQVDGAVAPAKLNGQAANGEPSAAKLTNGSSANGSANGASASQLKDQRELSLLDNLELFVSRSVYPLLRSNQCNRLKRPYSFYFQHTPTCRTSLIRQRTNNFL